MTLKKKVWFYFHKLVLGIQEQNVIRQDRQHALLTVTLIYDSVLFTAIKYAILSTSVDTLKCGYRHSPSFFQKNEYSNFYAAEVGKVKKCYVTM